jgi:hypothetical protein
MNRQFKAPEGSIRLFDVIKPFNEQAKVAFYFAIINTLYCDNLDRAINLSLSDDSNRRRVIAKKPNGGFAIY